MINAKRFALNTFNFRTTDELIEYGTKISKRLHFVIDTSREQVDAFLWIKRPGESDGSCNGGPPAGHSWPDYALGLIERAAPAR